MLSIGCGGHSWFNTLQESLVPWMVKEIFVILHKLKESSFMAVATKSSNNLPIEKCDFNQLLLNKIFYWTFPVI